MDKYIGQTIEDTEGRKFQLTEMIGSGTEGGVYRTQPKGYVAKIIYPSKIKDEKEIRRRYTWLYNRKIDRESRLVTPISVLKSPNVGYIMPEVKDHKPLSYMITPNMDDFATWYNISTLGLKKRLHIGQMLMKSFSNLHLNGLSYCDISPNNILISLNRPSVALIDCDNLSATGVAKSMVMGTPRYIAPEILNGKSQPNSLSDIYSLGVILFELLRLGHPLLGDAIMDDSPEVEQEALKGNAVYVEHPQDKSNTTESLLPAKDMFTEELKSVFEKIFIDGLHNPAKRPSLLEFRQAFVRAIEQIVECQNKDCGANYYYDTEGNKGICPWCGTEDNHNIANIYIGAKCNDDILEIKQTRKLIIRNNDETAIYPRFFEKFRDLTEAAIASIKSSNGSFEFVNRMHDDVKIQTINKNIEVLGYKQRITLNKGDKIVFENDYDEILVKEYHEDIEKVFYVVELI